jgi:hypothetical protein
MLVLLLFIWQIWRGTSEVTTATASKGCEGWGRSGWDSSAVHVPCGTLGYSTVWNWYRSLMFGRNFLPLFIDIKDETSVTITILTWCCTQTRTFFLTARHPRGATWHPIESDQVSTPAVTAKELLGVCVLEVSVSCGATFSVRGSSWISKLVHSCT